MTATLAHFNSPEFNGSSKQQQKTESLISGQQSQA
jgi:hypothetical protein